MFKFNNLNSAFPVQPATAFNGTYLVIAGGNDTGTLNATGTVYVGKLNSQKKFDWTFCAPLPDVTWKPAVLLTDDGYILVTGSQPLKSGAVSAKHVIYSGKMDSSGRVATWNQFMTPSLPFFTPGDGTALFLHRGYFYIVSGHTARCLFSGGQPRGSWEDLGTLGNQNLSLDGSAYAKAGDYLYSRDDSSGRVVVWKIGTDVTTPQLWVETPMPVPLDTVWGQGLTCDDRSQPGQGKIYMAGGIKWDSSALVKDVYVADISPSGGIPKTWRRIGSLSVARNTPHLHVANGVLICANGTDLSSNKLTDIEVWQLDHLDNMS